MDEGKLNRETKDAVDSMLPMTETAAKAFGIQISGTTCVIATQQLIGNGLYVYHPARSFSLASCVQELSSAGSIMEQLTTFQQSVNGIANVLEEALASKFSINQQFATTSITGSNGPSASILNWRRDIFYTPPRNTMPRVPLVLFGSPSSGLLLPRLLQAKHSSGKDGVDYDQFGWGEQEDGTWHNKITNEVQDTTPYE